MITVCILCITCDTEIKEQNKLLLISRLYTNGDPAGHPALLFAIQYCGKAGDWFWSIQSVPWLKMILHNTLFIFFKLICSTWINLKRDPHFALDISHMTSHVRNHKYKILKLKILIFLGDYFILIWYSVSIVVDGTASNYFHRTISFL